MSDDVNALVLSGADGQPAAEKLPFAGDLGQTGTRSGAYPVVGLHRLVQASENERVDVSIGRALAFLVACAPFVNADPHRQDRLLEVLERLLALVPSYELRFRPEVDIFDTVLESPDGEPCD